MNVNYIDLLLLLIVVVSVAQGWQRGFLLGFLDVLAWIGGVLLGLRSYPFVADWLTGQIGWSAAWSRPAAFLLTMLGASLAIQIAGAALLRRVSLDTHRGSTNRLLGTVPGALKGVLLAALTAALLLAVPLPNGVRATARESTLANRLAASTTRAEAALTPIFGDAVAQTLHTITVQPESDERVDLQCTVADAPPAPALEAEMLDLVNRERAVAGLAPLAADPALTDVARQHSADMFARGYFAHTTPEGRSPFDRMRAAGITYLTAGENLALAPTLDLAHTGLMNSPGHRANILQPAFGRLGIGILDGGACGLMVTQNFRD